MIYWVGLLSVLIAIEIVLTGTCVSIIFPAHPSGLVHDFFATYQHDITPKYDVQFLRLFMVTGVACFIALMRWGSRMTERQRSSLTYVTCTQLGLVAIEVFFLFKYAVFHFPLWLNGFYVTLSISVLVKVFAPEVLKTLRCVHARIADPRPFLNSSTYLTAGGMVLLALIIWVPDVEGAVARMFFGEHFHHMDWLLMTAGWAHLSGNILGVDTISRYGLGAPIIVSELTRHLLGRFDYTNALLAMMTISVIYYWIWFYALRLVLKDTAWALIAIFVGLRLHFFNIETFPFIFTYPQDTPLRFFFDSVFFLMVILHIQGGRRVFLYLASAVAGFYVFCITGEGAYTLATFYVFLVLRELYARMNSGTVIKRLAIKDAVLLVLVPWCVLLPCLWWEAGAHLFTPVFWSNMFEFIRFYQAGNQTALMINNLVQPYVMQAAVAFILPVLYLFVLLLFLGKGMQRSLKADGLVMATACVFLLISFQYHATLANNMPSYLRNGVVIAMLSVYGLQKACQPLDFYRQRLCKLAAGVAVMVMLVTTHQFLLHPNIFNLSRNPMTHPVVSQVPEGRKSYFSHLFISYPDAFKLPVNGLGQKEEMLVTENDFADDNQLKQFYRQESNYALDASLIQSLTAADQKVPVVSSFENLILMQANRRPFFYTYFMVNSQPRRMRKFPVTILFTKANLQREIDRIEDQKPPYIFVERTYLVSPIPQAYLYDNEDLIDLLSYIFSRYQPYKAGEFLVALKRR